MEKLREAQAYLTQICRDTEAPKGRQELALAIIFARIVQVFPELKKRHSNPSYDCFAHLQTAYLNHAQPDLGMRDCAALTPRDLGLLYEASLHPSMISHQGSVYTPTWIAAEIVAQVTFGLPKHPSILDPACGGGVFLLEGLRGGSHESIAVLELLSSLFGIDRDPRAVEVCRAALLLQAKELDSKLNSAAALRILTNNIRCADALLDPLPFAMPTDFDIVVGNPPYGLSRDERMQESEKRLLAERFAAWRSGKMNKYMLFMARGFELLKPHGQLSFIVPNSWLGISSAKQLRNRFLKEGSLLEIASFTEAVFEDPSVEVVTFLARKNAAAGKIKIVNRAAGKGVATSFELPVPAIVSKPEQTIPLMWNNEISDFFDHVHQSCCYLGDDDSPVTPMIALQAYATGKGIPPQTSEMVKAHVYDRDSDTEQDVYPYLEGSDIQRYRVAWSGRYLKHGPWLAEPQKISRFTGPRIILREILGSYPTSLFAAYIDTVALYNKSVLHLLPKAATTSETILALLGILNSPLGALILISSGQKSQRRIFPKIVNNDLKRFPIPKKLTTDCAKIAQLVTMRISCSGSKAEEIESSISNEVQRLYNVPSLPSIISKNSLLPNSDKFSPTRYTTPS